MDRATHTYRSLIVLNGTHHNRPRTLAHGNDRIDLVKRKQEMKTAISAAIITFCTVLSLGEIYNAANDPIPHHTEDDPDWSCVDDGNRVCGPNNPEGKPAGCYDIGGVLIAYWPCSPWKETDK